MIKALKTLFASPHRSFFLLGIFSFILIMAWWMHGQRVASQSVVPPGWSHTWLMVFSVFLPYFSGFLLTAYPRWLGAPGAAKPTWIAAWVLQCAGTVGFISGTAGNKNMLVLGATSWLLTVALLFGHLIRARVLGKGAWLHSLGILVMFSVGISSLVLLLASLVWGLPALAMISVIVCFRVFALGVFMVVAHRMIPFFAGCVLKPYQAYRPASLLLILLALAGAQAYLQIAGRVDWQWMALLPMTVICLFLAWKWQFWRAFQPRLLFSLFLAWGSLAMGLGIGAIQSFALWSGASLWAGRAPEHIIGIGFFGAMVIAMSTRVTLGHSGRPLKMGGLAWGCFLAVLGAALFRAGAEVSTHRDTLILISGYLWIAAGLLWAIRFGPMLALPRADHKPE